jgi:8-oxo-dGTP pyrophosphatase MutT (NUDIX family)
MPKNKPKDRVGTQFAALPFRINADGTCQVMLVTSRGTHRWIVPKGWPIKGLTPFEAAAREAYEEAGLFGQIVNEHPFGSYHYDKALPERPVRCEVSVFLLRVSRQAEIWPEKTQRETRWFDPTEAAGLVDEPGLTDLMRRFALAPPEKSQTGKARQKVK